MISLHSTPREMIYSPSEFHRTYPHQPNKLNGALYSVVTVVGLGGHAFGTWRSRKTGEMWLKDFLPRDVKRIRIFSYGYDSQSVGNHIDEDILDYRRNFLQMLENARRTAEVTKHMKSPSMIGKDIYSPNANIFPAEKTRPIIFIAHDIGGLLILQVRPSSN
jgi:hypothetical protein